MKIFVASPLGFADSTRGFISIIKEHLIAIGHEPIDPWSASQDLDEEFRRAECIEKQCDQVEAYHRISMLIAERNSKLLKGSDGVLAVLDGVDVDSGTASEIGYAFGLGGKVINGYRGDFRRSGENLGICVNLQVQYWIESSGGRIIRSLQDFPTLTFEQGK